MPSVETIQPPVAQSQKVQPAQVRPRLSVAGDLVIPFDADPKYFWWKKGGQSIARTRYELEKPVPILCTLVPTRRVSPIAPELAVYFAGTGPTSCPKCDCPTQREELTPTLQRHRCLECGHKFLIESK